VRHPISNSWLTACYQSGGKFSAQVNQSIRYLHMHAGDQNAEYCRDYMAILVATQATL